MPYTLVRGEFHVHYPDIPCNGPEPDGDTLKFCSDHPRDRDDRLLFVADAEIGNHDIVEVDDDRIRMNVWPEEVVILPDDK